MGTFVPGTKKEQLELLRAAGYESFEDMFQAVPKEVLLQKDLDLPEGKSEMETASVL